VYQILDVERRVRYAALTHHFLSFGGFRLRSTQRNLGLKPLLQATTQSSVLIAWRAVTNKVARLCPNVWRNGKRPPLAN